MIDKRVFCILLLIILFSSFVTAIAPLQSFEDELQGIKATQKQVEEEGWNYISGEFKSLMLKNKIILKIDSFCEKHSLWFSILFGISYSLSFALILVVLLWIYFSFLFAQLLGISDFLQGPLKILGGVIVSIILAQAGFFKYLALFLLDLIFASSYSWVRSFIGLALLVLAILFVRIFSKVVISYIKKKFKPSALEKIKESEEALLAKEEERERYSKLGDRKKK